MARPRAIRIHEIYAVEFPLDRGTAYAVLKGTQLHISRHELPWDEAGEMRISLRALRRVVDGLKEGEEGRVSNYRFTREDYKGPTVLFRASCGEEEVVSLATLEALVEEFEEG